MRGRSTVCDPFDWLTAIAACGLLLGRRQHIAAGDLEARRSLRHSARKSLTLTRPDEVAEFHVFLWVKILGGT
jgi:hypothetical protein